MRVLEVVDTTLLVLQSLNAEVALIEQTIKDLKEKHDFADYQIENLQELEKILDGLQKRIATLNEGEGLKTIKKTGQIFKVV